jgi:hypothetical protein
MMLPPFATLLLNEVRVRTRRLSSLVTLLVVIAISWTIVVDPATGRSMLTLGKHAVAYNSTAMAVGSSALASILLGLGGFYLVRGRTKEDLMYGVANVLGASPISNAQLLFIRWLGAMAYLCAIVLVLMLTMMVYQVVRGVGPVEPLIYLQTYALQLLPTLALAASIAVVCDSAAPLMGKFGDVLYFVCWMGQFGTFPQQLAKENVSMGLASSLDMSGMATIILRFRELFGTDSISIGGSRFDANLSTLVIENFWTAEMAGFRLVATLIATLPLLVAIVLFHRYSPDKVKPVAANAKSGLWNWLNRLARPVVRIVAPLYWIAPKLPRVAGQIVADAALTLSANPLLLLSLFIAFGAGVLVPNTALPGVLIVTVACWGIMVSDLSARDHQSATSALTGVVVGGVTARYLRQLSVALSLGLVASAPVLLRWSVSSPTQAMALVSGFAVLSAAAVLMGRLTRTGRTFLGCFLLGWYLATQVTVVRRFDVVGFNGIADSQTITTYGLTAVAISMAGWFWTRRTNT